MLSKRSPIRWSYLIQLVLFTIITGLIVMGSIRLHTAPEKSAPQMSMAPARVTLIIKTPQVITPAPTPEHVDNDDISLPVPLTEDSTVTTEALGTIGATEYHAQGITGAGIKVAVIDSQFAHVDDSIARQELPSEVTFLSFTNGTPTSTIDVGRTGHGTACAEIIHDVAPNAELYLIHTPDLTANLDAIINWLAEENVKIVSISMSILSESDAVYETLRIAREDYDMLVIFSAGNYARQHTRTPFLDTDGDSTHEFAVSEVPDDAELLPIWIQESQGINVLLQWEDEIAQYQLDILDADGAVLASNENQAKSNTVALLPSNITGLVFARISVLTAPATQDTLHLTIRGGIAPLVDYQVAQGSIAFPADSPYVLTTGAADAITEQYLTTSSQGSTGGGRIKPDMVSHTNVSTSVPGYGIRGFSGTSAAAPHVAGMAALLWSSQDYAKYNACEMANLLTESTEDRGVPGPDTTWGAGITRLPVLNPTLHIHPDDITVKTQVLDSHTLHASIRVHITRADGAVYIPSVQNGWQAEVGGRLATLTAVRKVGEYAIFDIAIPYSQWNTRATEAEQLVMSWHNTNASTTLLPPTNMQAVHTALNFELPASELPLGAILPIQASITSQVAELGASVHAEIIAPHGHTTVLPLHDDGQLSDAHADDAVYSATFPQLHEEGRYVIRMYASGINTAGQYYNLTQTRAFYVNAETSDIDQDGLPDVWEDVMALNQTADDTASDPDGDRLSNAEEYLTGSDPLNWDSDGDGLSDYEEVNSYFVTLPYSTDSDVGGVRDTDELRQQTNPLLASDDFNATPAVYMPTVTAEFIPPYDTILKWEYTNEFSLLWAATPDGLILHDVEQNRFRLFNNTHGLPDKPLRFVYIDSDSHVWATSDHSVYRSDQPVLGIEDQPAWSSIAPIPDSVPRIQTMIEAPENTFWFGTNAGLWRYADQKWELAGLADESITALYADLYSIIRLGTQSGKLFTLNAKEWDSIHKTNGIIELHSPAHNRITDIDRDMFGGHWITTWGNGAYIQYSDEWNPIKPDAFINNDFIHHIVLNGYRVFLREHQSILAKEDNFTSQSGWRYFSNHSSDKVGLPLDVIYEYRLDRNGNRQVTSSVVRLLPAAIRLTYASELGARIAPIAEYSSNNEVTHPVHVYEITSTDNPLITALSIDNNDTVWLGTMTGLLQFDPDIAIWQSHRPDAESPYLAINTIYHSDHTTWIGTHGQGVYRIIGEQWQHFMPADGLNSLYAHALAKDGLGTVWAGSASGIGGLSQFTEEWATADISGLPGDLYSHDLATHPDGSLWIASNRGIYVIHDNDVQHFDIDDGLPTNEVLTLHITSDGEVWAGTRSGASVWKHKQWQTPPEAWTASRIWDIAGQGDTLAFATTQGIWLRRDSIWQRFELPNTPASLPYTHLAFGPDGHLWIATGANIYDVNLDQ